MLVTSCTNVNTDEIDRLNEQSYAYHYRNLDSTRVYAEKALQMSRGYSDGKAEALNNLAFVSLAHMDYAKVVELIGNLDEVTDNEVELLIADIQLMRLCQRQSRNKDFYTYRERASSRLRRIDEEQEVLTPHQKRRMIYAHSEFQIVNSTYFYYVGLTKESVEALDNIDEDIDFNQDSAQVLNYLYNVGSGGIIHAATTDETNQREFDYLMRCYQGSLHLNYPFFVAQSLQALSEHLRGTQRDILIADNLPAIRYLNIDDMPDTLLSGNLAQRALNIFTKYGDVYQIAGAYRTLAECYWEVKDYRSALICLQNALYRDTVIERAPDLVASIREQLSLCYSAIDDKQKSDYNRNIYLDIQERTRQDRQLEARAEQLNKSSEQLNWMIFAVVFMIILVVILLFVFDRMRRDSDKKYSMESLLKPLERWKEMNDAEMEEFKERQEELKEQTQIEQLHTLQNRKRDVEQRAKISIVNSITPFIDRIIHEVQRLRKGDEPENIRQERFVYISELTDKINEYNDVLTKWIQLRQGELSLHIESFPLQELFNIVSKSKMGFILKGVTLHVEDTSAVVKADKTLTLFMINTLADNARKFTDKGGDVYIYAQEADRYVEVSVKDNGIGMSEEQASHVFDHKPITDEQGDLKEEHSHGFGLMNCKGIIDKYKKISQLFSMCDIGVETLKKGSRFWFRLPKGFVRIIILLTLCTTTAWGKTPQEISTMFADSAYYSNIHGTYEKTLLYGDSCINSLNETYKLLVPNGKIFMKIYDRDNGTPAELNWMGKGLKFNYTTIMSVRNEIAIAALALHKWNIYHYNNKAYTHLFRAWSSDKTLGNYVYVMQKSETNKNVAIIILIILLVLIIPAYYLLYYRYRLSYRFNIDLVDNINKVLLSDLTPEEKLHRVNNIWGKKQPLFNVRSESLDNLVEQIKRALQQSIDSNQEQQTSIELSEDELRRANYENAKLHVSNSVLDNCLSNLKHETMYYPSRIRQLIDNQPCDLHALSDIVDYYKALYVILSSQAMRQLEGGIKIDNYIVKYLLELLEKVSGEKHLSWQVSERDANYVIITIPMQKVNLSEQQCSNLFTPLTVDFNYMLCRQIVREIGEATNKRACGISAQKVQQGILVKIILPKEIWKNSKL